MMQMFMLVLNHEECLEPILEEMALQGFSGATILDSTGMMHTLNDDENADLPMLGVLRHLLNPSRRTSKTLFTVIAEEKIPALMKIINDKTGGLDKPDTGIAFAVPTTFVEGMKMS